MSNIDFIRKAAKIARGGGHLADEKRHYKVLKPRLRTLKVKLGKKLVHSTNTEIFDCPELARIYDRKKLCLKVFWRSTSMWGYAGAGGISTILESTIAQNLLAMKGICPRVYDLVLVDGKTAQVTDYLTGFKKKPVVNDSRFDFYRDDWARDHNYLDGKMFDLQGTKLKNYGDYKDCVIKELIKRNGAHGHTTNLYQSTGYHPGLRDTKARLAQYNFKDFKNKRVLDIGCSNGMFCRRACDLGAKRVVGIDWPDMVEMAQELAILDGYYNIDFYGLDIKNTGQKLLTKTTGISRFDIHLFLAMETHVGWPEWVKNCDRLYYEGHGRVRPFKVFHFDKNGREVNHG